MEDFPGRLNAVLSRHLGGRETGGVEGVGRGWDKWRENGRRRRQKDGKEGENRRRGGEKERGDERGRMGGRK